MKYSTLLRLLLLAFSPRVDDDEFSLPDDTPPADDTPTDDDTPADDDTPMDDDTPTDDDTPAPRETRAQREIRSLRERAQAAETARQAAEAQLEAARRQPHGQPHLSEEQIIFQQEEEALRNPETSDWQRYAIQSARQARAANANSRDALQRAEDMADRTRFEQIKLTKPKLYETYADRVEEMLKTVRAAGNNAPREKLLALLMGEDLLNGKLKPTAAKAPNGGAKRTTTPGARSDVRASGEGGLTEAQKRAKRLENVRI